jgi:hypothetical protein
VARQAFVLARSQSIGWFVHVIPHLSSIYLLFIFNTLRLRHFPHYLIERCPKTSFTCCDGAT